MQPPAPPPGALTTPDAPTTPVVHYQLSSGHIASLPQSSVPALMQQDSGAKQIPSPADGEVLVQLSSGHTATLPATSLSALKQQDPDYKYIAGNVSANQPSPITQPGFLTGLISKAKDAWTAGQAHRAAEAQVVSDTVDALKRGDFGTAAEGLLDHLAHTAKNVASGVAGGLEQDYQNAKAVLTQADPQHGKMYAMPIAPGPGVSTALKSFSTEEAAAATAAQATPLVNPFRAKAVSTAAPVPSDPGFIQQVWQGEKVNQAPAQAATRAAVQAGGDEVGLSTVQPAGIRTLAEEPINVVNGLKKTLYGQVDQAAGTDLKSLYDKLDAINDKIDLEASGSPEESRLEAQRTSQMQTIDDAKAVAKTKGVDVDQTLAKADALHTREMALRDVQKGFLKNVNIVEGSAASGTPETVKVDSAVKALQKLQDNTKYGAPRLEQAFGKAGAKQLLDDMYAAQRLGAHAMKVQKIAGWISGIIGVPTATAVAGTAAYEITH